MVLAWYLNDAFLGTRLVIDLHEFSDQACNGEEIGGGVGLSSSSPYFFIVKLTNNHANCYKLEVLKKA